MPRKVSLVETLNWGSLHGIGIFPINIAIPSTAPHPLEMNLISGMRCLDRMQVGLVHGKSR